MLKKLREYKNEAGAKLCALKACGTFLSLAHEICLPDLGFLSSLQPLLQAQAHRALLLTHTRCHSRFPDRRIRHYRKEGNAIAARADSRDCEIIEPSSRSRKFTVTCATSLDAGDSSLPASKPLTGKEQYLEDSQKSPEILEKNEAHEWWKVRSSLSARAFLVLISAFADEWRAI